MLHSIITWLMCSWKRRLYDATKMTRLHVHTQITGILLLFITSGRIVSGRMVLSMQNGTRHVDCLIFHL